MSNRIGNSNYFGKHEAYGNRELKYYKDIYGNDVRLMTSREKNAVNKSLVISSIFIVILLSGFFYKAYLVKKETEERTRLYLMSGESITEGKDIVLDGGVIISEDEEVVAVEGDGTIVAKSSGTTNVTVYKNIDENDFIEVDTVDDSEGTIYDMYNALGVEGEFTFEVTVQQNVTGVSLNIPVVNLKVGETNRIIAKIFPHTSYNKEVTWTSSNPNVATVDSKGVVSGRSSGTTTITVTTKDGSFKDSTLVNVSKKESNNNIYLTLDNDFLYVDDVVDLVTVVSPNEKLLSKVVYSSSDSSVATINSNGRIVAKKSGKTTITARIASEEISSSIDVVVVNKEIENIYLSSTNLTLNVFDVYNLKTYLFPKEVSSPITYTSSDSSVASVDSNGKIVALKEGIATITVKGNNDVLSKCVVQVENDFVKANGIEMLLDASSINVGERTFITTVIEPVGVLNKNVTYTSSDSGIAKVFEDGSILGVKPGNVIITATNSGGVSDSVSLKVENTVIDVNKIKMNFSTNILAGKSQKLDFTIEPSNATNTNIIWTSEDPSIAKVNELGVVTGVSHGSTTITASIGNVKATTIVSVFEIKADKLELNYNEVNFFMGDSITLKAMLSPSNVTNTDVIWKSNDDRIVQVDEAGKVTAIKDGTTIVTALSKSNPQLYSECLFNVSKIDVESYKVSHDQIIINEGESVTVKVSDVKPRNASYIDADYSIKDEAIAVVSDGVVTGVYPGKTTMQVDVDGIVKTLDLTVMPAGEKVYFIDTFTSVSGASDAILLESNGKYALIDTGSNVASFDTIKFLKDRGVKRLEFILITHFHSENFGGIYGENPTNNILLSDIKVGKIYMKPYSSSDSYFLDNQGGLLKNRESIINRRNIRNEMFINIKGLIVDNNISYTSLNAKNNVLELGNFKLNLYNLEDQLKAYSLECLEKYNCNENSNSIVTYAKVNGKSLYFASDIYNAYNNKNSKYLKTKTEEVIAKTISDEHGKNIDIYKAANYGSSASNVSGALENINPKYSIITNSKYNFDDDSVGLDRIKEYTSDDIYYAGDGTVIANIDLEGNISFIQLDN